MLAAGLIAGPATGLIDPEAQLGGLFRPIIAFADASPFALTPAEGLGRIGAPVLIAGDNRCALRPAKREEREAWRGEVPSETFVHDVDQNRYGHLIAATPSDVYNALVCTDYAPEFGRNMVRQIARQDREEADHLPISTGVRGIEGAETYEALNEKARDGWRVSATELTDEYRLDACLAEREDAILLGVAREGTEIAFFCSDAKPEAKPGDVMLALTPPEREAA